MTDELVILLGAELSIRRAYQEGLINERHLTLHLMKIFARLQALGIFVNDTEGASGYD